MKHLPDKRWVLAGALAAGTASFCLVSHRLTGKMMQLAMGRTAPRMRIAHTGGSAEQAELAARMQRAARQLENSGCETVTVTGRDGVPLAGHWHHTDHAKRIILAMHGWRSSWAQDFGIISAFWHANDCDVLYAEQRGQDHSGGDYMSFGLLERYDCLTWLDWINARTGGTLPIYLAGVSMGATTVLMAAGLDLPDNVCGIAADSAFTAPHAIWKHVSEHGLHIPYALHRASADRLCRKWIHMDANAASTTEALQHCKVPVFLIHGADDHFVPVEMTYENYKACRAPKRLLIVPGADHCMSYLCEPETYQRMILDFWADCERRYRASHPGAE